MEEPRKIVFILGNGFDLSLGLKTSYKDFWESEFCPRDYPAPLIQYLNKQWSDELEAVRWYDLENELHAYALLEDKTDVIDEKQRSYVRDHSDYELTLASTYTGVDEVFESLVNAGIIHITGVLRSAHIPFRVDLLESAAWRDRKAFVLIKEGLCKYLQTLSPPTDRTKSVAAYVYLAVSSAYKQDEFVNVYSFNYTPTPSIGRLIDDRFIHHLHGDCSSGKIIIGTRDDLNYGRAYDFFQKSFDPNYNPPALVEDLAEADEVVVFGHSLGENDRQYFMPYFMQQASYGASERKNITVFTYDEASKMEIKRSLQRMTDGNLSMLYGRNNLQIIKTGELASDQQAFKDFLLRFFSDEHQVEDIIGKLLSQ